MLVTLPVSGFGDSGLCRHLLSFIKPGEVFGLFYFIFF